ncbi:agamous-like MADS-box protein AGL80 [Benincasa hispida]|uniref:agamous-like MADS-box protein AGL80 n=1 Tax=Benincasa hispida TaxID=102211 RepID=UPI001901C094|nr:agamous-like MADS-box protein AGL80 [Benincasa hispida]
MTRKKVKLAYIENDSARKATYKKRKRGLMKKISELSILCGIEACAIIFSPYDSQPELWPSPIGVQRVLSQFKRMPEMEQSKKMVNQETFLRQRIAKANEQLKKLRKDNREKEITRLMFQCLTATKELHGINMHDLNDLGWLVDQNLKEIATRIESLKKPSMELQLRSQPQPQPQPPSQPSTQPQTAAWLMELESPQDQMRFVGDDMLLPFGDQTYNYDNAMWSNAFFP